MVILTLDMQSSAQMLGIKEEEFQDLIEEEQLEGIIKSKSEWRVSVFTLAGLLNTTPDNLLEIMEDYVLGARIEECAGDEIFEGEESLDIYAQYLAEVE